MREDRETGPEMRPGDGLYDLALVGRIVFEVPISPNAPNRCAAASRQELDPAI